MWLNKLQEAFKQIELNEGFPFRQTENSGHVTCYKFHTDTENYEVKFEFADPEGYWEMIFGTIDHEGLLDTSILTNQPQDVVKVLNTIFIDILADFVKEQIEFDGTLQILLAPQCVKGETVSTNPFKRKRGRVYVRKIYDALEQPFWKQFQIDFRLSDTYPPAIMFEVKKIFQAKKSKNQLKYK